MFGFIILGISLYPLRTKDWCIFLIGVYSIFLLKRVYTVFIIDREFGFMVLLEPIITAK